MSFVAFCLAVREYRRIFDGSVTSWGRSREHNRRVGGVPHSRHLSDMAVDVIPAPGARAEHRIAQGQVLDLWVLPEGDHDHLEPLDLHAAPPAHTHAPITPGADPNAGRNP